VIFDIDVSDQDAYGRYTPLSAASVASHGGRFVVRGGSPAPLEGGWEPSRIVVIEFPDAAAARRWFESDEYQAARPLRLAASAGRGIIVEGA
jgi:uncharacterized protein (DUF1330 family)